MNELSEHKEAKKELVEELNTIKQRLGDNEKDERNMTEEKTKMEQEIETLKEKLDDLEIDLADEKEKVNALKNDIEVKDEKLQSKIEVQTGDEEIKIENLRLKNDITELSSNLERVIKEKIEKEEENEMVLTSIKE